MEDAPARPNPVKAVISDVRSNLAAMRATAERARLPLLNGALARAGVALALFPLDTIKTRAQMRTASGMPRVGQLLRGGNHLLHDKIMLLRGAPAGALAAVGAGALSFVVYTTLAARARTGSVVAAKTVAAPAPSPGVAAYVAAEVAAGVWAVPLERVKTRVQTGLHANVWQSLRSGWRSGPSGLYGGSGAHLVRELPTRALFVVLASKVGDFIAEKRGGKRLGKAQEAAAVAAVVAGITAPLDLVRTRVLAQRSGAGRMYSNFVGCAAKIVRSEGPLAVFRGAPLRVTYLALSTGLFAAGYSFTERTLKEKKLLWYAEEKVEDAESK